MLTPSRCGCTQLHGAAMTMSINSLQLLMMMLTLVSVNAWPHQRTSSRPPSVLSHSRSTDNNEQMNEHDVIFSTAAHDSVAESSDVDSAQVTCINNVIVLYHFSTPSHTSKTKEIVMGPPSKTFHLLLHHLSLGDIERVNSVKLLGINLDADFSWKSHVEAITSKATQRLYFLKQLRRAGVPQAQLLYFYTGVIRPVLEIRGPGLESLAHENTN